MNVSIVLPLHKPDKSLLNKILKAIKNQKFSGRKEIILVDEGLGLADSLNYGIKKAKYDIIVSLPQDCIPSSKYWLDTILKPLAKGNVVATTSKVELPYELWNNFDRISKILSSKEQGVFTTLMDERGCAYRKNILLEVGLFDGIKFRTAGEDYDMYLKLASKGKIEHTNAKVIHYHRYTWRNRFKKEIQLSNGFGSCVRIFGRRMIFRSKGFIRAIPLLGWPFFLYKLKIKKLGLINSILAIPLYLFVNFLYAYGFWKGFLMGRQTV